MSRRLNIAEYILIDCATGLSYGPFELLDRACHRAEVGNIAKWEVIDCDDKLVAWSIQPATLTLQWPLIALLQ